MSEEEEVTQLKIELLPNGSYKVTNLTGTVKGHNYTVYTFMTHIHKLEELMDGKKTFFFTISSHPELFNYLDEIEAGLDYQWKKCTVQGRKELGLKDLSY